MDIFMYVIGGLAMFGLGWLVRYATGPKDDTDTVVSLEKYNRSLQRDLDAARSDDAHKLLQVDYSALSDEFEVKAKQADTLAKRVSQLEGELEDAEEKAGKASNAVDMLSDQLADAEARLASVDDDGAEQALLSRIATLEKEIATLSSDKGNKIMRSESAKYRAIKNVTDPKLWASIAKAVNAKLKDGGFSKWKNPPTKIKVR